MCVYSMRVFVCVQYACVCVNVCVCLLGGYRVHGRGSDGRFDSVVVFCSALSEVREGSEVLLHLYQPHLALLQAVGDEGVRDNLVDLHCDSTPASVSM